MIEFMNVEVEMKQNNKIKCLIEHETNINKNYNNGKTPIFKARESKNEIIAKYLIEKSEKVNN